MPKKQTANFGAKAERDSIRAKLNRDQTGCTNTAVHAYIDGLKEWISGRN